MPLSVEPYQLPLPIFQQEKKYLWIFVWLNSHLSESPPMLSCWVSELNWVALMSPWVLGPTSQDEKQNRTLNIRCSVIFTKHWCLVVKFFRILNVNGSGVICHKRVSKIARIIEENYQLVQNTTVNTKPSSCWHSRILRCISVVQTTPRFSFLQKISLLQCQVS